MLEDKQANVLMLQAHERPNFVRGRKSLTASQTALLFVGNMENSWKKDFGSPLQTKTEMFISAHTKHF